MAKRLKILHGCIAMLFLFNTTNINGQILQDTSTVNLIKKGMGYIYDFQFREAKEVYIKIAGSYPGHPVTFLFRGMMMYWENYPLLPTSPVRILFEKDLHNCMELSEKKHNPADEPEYLLANLCAKGLLLLYYSDNELNVEMFPLIPGTYESIRRSFGFSSGYPDLNYFTGTYDYYREAYPEFYPIYRPLAILFPKGDKEKGIKELQNAAQNSIVMRAEAYSVLSEIYLRFEGNFQQATYYNKTLFDLYPSNPEFKEEYIKNLILIKQYDLAERLILSSDSTENNSYFKAQITIYKGIIKEKKYHDFKQAEELYLKGARDISLFGNIGNELEAYAYFGLSRISDSNGDKHFKKVYRKLANKLTDLKEVDFD